MDRIEIALLLAFFSGLVLYLYWKEVRKRKETRDYRKESRKEEI